MGPTMSSKVSGSVSWTWRRYLSSLDTSDDTLSHLKRGLFKKTVARVKYEITFYTVALTFLIFELELLFIFPLLLSLQQSHKSF